METELRDFLLSEAFVVLTGFSAGNQAARLSLSLTLTGAEHGAGRVCAGIAPCCQTSQLPYLPSRH